MPSIINHSRRIRLENTAFTVNILVQDYAPDNTGAITVPAGNRLWAWKSKKGLVKQSKLIDSAMYGYPIPSLILNRSRRGGIRVLEVYDGRHRIETLWNYANDRIKWNGHFFSELSEEDRRVFLERTIPVTITDGATNAQLAELFIRVNAGVPLKDSDLLWANRESPFVRSVRQVIEDHPRLSAALGGLDLKTRSDLANWAAYVAGLSTNVAGNMTTSYVRLAGDEGLGLDLAVDEQAVRLGLNAYCTLLESANAQFPSLPADQRKYKKVGRIAAFFFAEYMSTEDKVSVHDKWLSIIGRLRGSNNDADAMSAALHTTGAQNLTAAKIEQTLDQVNAFLAGALPAVADDADDSDSDV
jgi:hypothetical protein